MATKEHFNKLRDNVFDAFRERFDSISGTLESLPGGIDNSGYPKRDHHPYPTAHDGTLALSWEVGLGYLRSCAYRSAIAQAQRNNRSSQSVTPTARRRMLDDAYARYDGIADGKFKVDCYIFFKDSSVPPDINPTMSPAFNKAFHDAPLHHHFAIWRMQRPNPSSKSVEFTDWYAHPAYAATLDDAARTFATEVLIDPCPARPADPKRNWQISLGAIIAGIAAVLFAGFIFRESLAETFGFATPRQRIAMEEAVQQLRDDARVLQERYQSELRFVEAYQNRLNQLTASGAPRHEIEALERDLARSQQNLEQVTVQLAETGAQLEPARAGTGLAACWMTGGDEPRTAYLFDLYLDDRGITVNYAESAAPRASQDGVPVRNIPMGTPLSPQSFIEATRPVFAASEADPRCRHFVILREGVHASTTTYQRQRDAVEQHFYIFRP